MYPMISFDRALAFVFCLVAILPAVSFADSRGSEGRLAPLAVEVAFSSFGSGIDGDAQREILEVMNEKVRSGKLVAMTVKRWGREGERTMCFQFSNTLAARQMEDQVLKIAQAGNAASNRGKTSVALALNCSGQRPSPNM
jgi:hypothetical protein